MNLRRKGKSGPYIASSTLVHDLKARYSWSESSEVTYELWWFISCSVLHMVISSSNQPFVSGFQFCLHSSLMECVI